MQKCRDLSTITCLVMALGAPICLHSASFDCSKAHRGYEALICANPALSSGDETLNAVYRKTQAALSLVGTEKESKKAIKHLQDEEKDWLKKHLSKCSDANCIQFEYESRIATLERYIRLAEAATTPPEGIAKSGPRRDGSPNAVAQPGETTPVAGHSMEERAVLPQSDSAGPSEPPSAEPSSTPPSREAKRSTTPESRASEVSANSSSVGLTQTQSQGPSMFEGNVVTTPDPAHAGLADPLCDCHRAATPVRASFGLRLQSGVNHGLDSSHIVTGFPAPAGCNLPKRLGPTLAKALAPQANRLTVHAVLSGDHCLWLASGNGQDNAAT